MRISVVIPTYNEEKAIESTLNDLVVRHHPDEVIVADGGSRDRTLSLLSKWKEKRVKVVTSEKGRARQLNRGAREASGEILLFLHADTKLPEGGLGRIKAEILTGKAGGRFQLQFDGESQILRLNSFLSRFQWFSCGDQAFFVTRALFQALGGFREDRALEDVDFYRRLRQQTRPVILKERVTTSARRFTQVGLVRQKLINILLVCLDGLGFNISSLKARLYSDVR